MPKVKELEKELKRVAAELAEVGMYLSAAEKREAAVNLGCHDDTVRGYIKGDIAKLPFGLRLLAELNRLKARQDANAVNA